MLCQEMCRLDFYVSNSYQNNVVLNLFICTGNHRLVR